MTTIISLTVIIKTSWIIFHNNFNYHKLGSGNGMGGLLIDKLYNPSEMIITDMETHMDHINHNIKLNKGKYLNVTSNQDLF